MSDSGSLLNLHDIILPQPVSWWPATPGWYIVLGILLMLILVLIVRGGLRYHRNAYRRAAMAELRALDDVAYIAMLLKRTALAVYPREQVASLTGKEWVEWLSETSGIEIPDSAEDALMMGVYGGSGVSDPNGFREFAEKWIRRHKGVL